MTDNTEFKKEGSELLNKLIYFKRKFYIGGGRSGSNLEKFEQELRNMLTIARTDEENAQQNKWG